MLEKSRNSEQQSDSHRLEEWVDWTVSTEAQPVDQEK